MRVLLALVVLLWAVPGQGATRFALVMGNNIGLASEGALRWAERDAQRVRTVLVELGSVVEQRATLKLGSSAREIRLELARLRGQVEEAKRRGERTEIFLFYSGHGDDASLHPGPEMLLLDELHREIQEIPADARIVVIDACRSEALKRGRGKGASHAEGFEINLKRDSGPQGLVLITSVGSREVAQESDALKSSFFTHHMVSGLRGAADADKDGLVTLDEFYRYVYHRTLAGSHGTTAAVQHPEMELDLAGEGELVFSFLEQAGSVLLLPAGLGGDFLVVDDHSNRVVAEVRKPASEESTLALPPGRYRVQLRSAGRIYAAEISLAWGGERVLHRTSLREQPLEAALEKGNELDPRVWALTIGVRGAMPTALGRGFAGGLGLSLQSKLFDWPLFAVADMQLASSAAENSLWRYHHVEQHLGVGLGYSYHFGPAHLSAALLGGLLMVEELALRHDGEHISRVTGADAYTTALASGPFSGLEISLRFAFLDFLSPTVGVGGHAAWLPISGEHRITAELHGIIGWTVEF